RSFTVIVLMVYLLGCLFGWESLFAAPCHGYCRNNANFSDTAKKTYNPLILIINKIERRPEPIFQETEPPYGCYENHNSF
ncbi:hypothetical protein, partial [Haliea sp.]|uniref:hypothetical protein n=1 Tax=Haliea TaxID=475794 RepID=UPI00257F5FC8